MSATLIVATATQTRRRKHLETEIRQSAQTMGANLKVIHDEGLFKSTHGSWEAHCFDVWGISRGYAYRLLKHGKILALLGEQEVSPIGDTSDGSAVEHTVTESATRVVADMPDDEAVTVLAEAVATSPTDSVTAAHVQEARDNLETEPMSAADDEPEKKEEERLAWNRQVESFARKITSLIDDAPVGPWLNESRLEHVANQLRSAAATARQAKCHSLTKPGCTWDRGVGYAPQRIVDQHHAE